MNQRLILIVLALICEVCCNSNNYHYNIPDPECTGPFGLCTQADKDRLGYLAIKKLHEKMDDDQDGHVEVQETKEFITEELQYKNGIHSTERQQKFHGSDTSISIDEMWKSWQHSHVYNWTIDDIVIWLNEQIKLPQYADYFRRNKIDGQFLPRLAVNDNNYISSVMQIRDIRHKRLIMLKATDLILFGQATKPHNLIKDVLMITALTFSIFLCIYLYTKHRQSLEQIKKLIGEFDKLTSVSTATAVDNDANLIAQIKNNIQSKHVAEDSLPSSLSLFSLRRRSSNNDGLSAYKKQNELITEKNLKLLKELNYAKIEAENLRKARENADGQVAQLQFALQELDKVSDALKQAEARLEIVKYHPPTGLVNLLNKSHEFEKDLLEYKYKLIEKERIQCYEELHEISKKNSGIFGALKITHSSVLEKINHKIHLIKREMFKYNAEKQESIKRWENIFEICGKSESNGAENSSLEAQQSISEEASLKPNQTITNLINSNANQTVLNVQQHHQTLPYQSSISIISNKKESLFISKSNNEENGASTASNRNMIINEPAVTSKVEFELNAAEDSNNNHLTETNLNHNQFKSNTSKSYSNLPVTAAVSKKIARDSMIHKNDVFQFDDVESIVTSNIYFKKNFSFESDDTYKSDENQNHKPQPILDNNKKLVPNFLTPIFRGVNANGSLKHTKNHSKVGPESISSKNSSKNSKMKKSVTAAAIENNKHATTNTSPNDLSANMTSATSLERSSTFTRHLSSFKKFISPKETSSDSLIKQSSTSSASQANQENGHSSKETNGESINVQPNQTVFNAQDSDSLSPSTCSINNKTQSNQHNSNDIATNGDRKRSKNLFKFKLNSKKKNKII